MPARILIVDDHEVVRQGVRAVIQSCSDWQVCGEAENGQRAVALAKQTRPDLILLDITMPVMNGLDAAREISKLKLGSRILIFTMHDSDTLMATVRSAGAHGCVLKSNAAKDVVVAIDALLKGKSFFQAAREDCMEPKRSNTLRSYSPAGVAH